MMGGGSKPRVTLSGPAPSNLLQGRPLLPLLPQRLQEARKGMHSAQHSIAQHGLRFSVHSVIELSMSACQHDMQCALAAHSHKLPARHSLLLPQPTQSTRYPSTHQLNTHAICLPDTLPQQPPTHMHTQARMPSAGIYPPWRTSSLRLAHNATGGYNPQASKAPTCNQGQAGICDALLPALADGERCCSTSEPPTPAPINSVQERQQQRYCL
jgi:hypothetical protein